MAGGQSGTYLRLTRASSGPQVSVAKTYRNENETKMNISAKSQKPSSAVEYRRHQDIKVTDSLRYLCVILDKNSIQWKTVEGGGKFQLSGTRSK